MKMRQILICVLVVGFGVTLVDAGSRVGRGAGRGAAMGAVFGLLLGGDIDDAIEGAAVGAAAGAVGGAIDNSYAKKDRQRYSEQQRAQQLATAQAQAREAERKQLEAEKSLAAEAVPETVVLGGEALTEEQWIIVVGVDNWNALVALVDCQHQRARLLAQAGATVDDPEYALASRWIEMLIAVDSRDAATSNRVSLDLVNLDSDIDTIQQASIEADKAILDVRQIRREEGISCVR